MHGRHDRAMAKWVCPCGNIIRSSGAIPNTQEWRLIADVDLEEVAAAARLTSDDDIVTFIRRTRLAYKCERCDRLHIYWNDDQSRLPDVYVREPPSQATA